MSTRYTPPTISVQALRGLLEQLPPDWLLEPNKIGGIEVRRPDGTDAGFIDIVEASLELNTPPDTGE